MHHHWSNRQRAARWVVAALFLAGCKSSTSPGSTTPAGLYKGTFVSGSTSGVLTLTFPAASGAIFAASILPISLNFAAAAAPVTVTGTMALTGVATPINLTGTYDAAANPQLSLTGTGAGGTYTVSGNYTASSGHFAGTIVVPSGSGTWTAAGGSTVRVFCGTYDNGSGVTKGTWNLVLDANNGLIGLANTSSGQIALSGIFTPGTPTGSVSVSWSGGTAMGSLNLTTGGGNGTWSATGGGSGNWTATTTGC